MSKPRRAPGWLARLAATALACVLALVLAPASRAQLQVDITRGHLEPLPIAVLDFYGQSPVGRERGQDIAKVITADLERSGLFRPIDRRAFIDPEGQARTAAAGVQPRYADWRAINAQALVTGSAELGQDGRMRIEFRLWDVFGGAQMAGFAYGTQPSNWRRVAHIIADAIYKRITGEEGYFDTRIVYIAESGPPDRRVKRLAIMDQDGAGHQFLSDGGALVLTPRFSPTAQEISYLSYVAGTPRVYLYNIDTAQQEVIGEFPGMTFAPRFSPDGNRVIMSMAEAGNSDLYTMDLRTRRIRRLTNHPAIDTSPSFSPDGRRIVFNSDRGGSQQLYVMDQDGSDVRRISFGDGRYATPIWSPRGDLIAFTKLMGGRFAIGVMRPDGSGERLLTEGFLVEGPTWAPNGRVLMYFKQTPADRQGRGQSSRLHSIDLTGYNEREITTPLDGSDPAWSPLKQ
jgi:TolB protein